MASMRKISGKYYARFYDKYRSPKRKTYPLRTTRKDVARRRLTGLEKKFERGEFDPWTDDSDGTRNPTVKEAIGAFLENKKGHVRERTLDTYDDILSRWERDCCPAGLLLRDVQEEHLRCFIFQSKTENATKRKRFRHLRAFFNWTAKAGYLKKSPLAGALKPKKEKKTPAFLTPDQLERLLRAIDAHREMHLNESGPTPDVQWLKDAIELACCTGLRRGELLALRWEDVDLNAKRLFVRSRRGEKTKTGNERVIPLAAPAMRVLQRRQTERPDGVTRVITDRNHKPVKPDRLSRRFKDMVRKAKLRNREDLHFHSTRHTCGAWLASNGASERIMQQYLGHETRRMVGIYGHVMGPTLEEAAHRSFGAP